MIWLAERNTRSLLLLKWPIHMHCMHWLWPKYQHWLCCAVLDCFVAVQKEKQSELLWCQSTRPERIHWVQPAAAECLYLFRPAQYLAVLHLAVTQLQSHLPFRAKCPKRLMSNVQHSCRCRGQLMELVDIYWVDLSRPDSTDPDLIFLLSLQQLLLNVKPNLVSMCPVTIIQTSIHSSPGVLFRDLNFD